MNAMMRTSAPESAREAVGRLFSSALHAGFKLTGLHRYNTATGDELLRVVRLKYSAWASLTDAGRDALRQRYHCDGKGKIIRQMHRADGRYLAKAPAKPANGWPLYRPPYPLVDTKPVIYVEGEACADELAKRGIPAVASLGGAKQAGDSDWTAPPHDALQWRDNDQAGDGYMIEVAAKLHAIGCTVERIDVAALGLPVKGDVVDWLALHPNATADDVLALPRVKVEPAPVVDTMPRAVLVRGDAVKPEPVDWLWDGWLAAGKLHLIGGAPGTGKTTIATALAATITAGGRWPDGSRAERGSVVFWSGEDDLADTLAPRLIAAGADMTRVHMVDGVREGADRYPFDPARDVDALRLAMVGIPDVRLIVVDPIVSAVAGDSHKNAEVRRGLQPIVDLGMQCRAAVLGVTHFSKGTSGREPTERITGSLAFGALARLILVTAKQEADGDREERRVLLRAKSNIGPDGGGFVYSLEQTALPSCASVTASRVLWGARIEGSAREVLADVEQVDVQERDAVGFLRDLLVHAPMAAKDIKAEATSAGYSMDAMHRAKRKLHAEAVKSGMAGGWFWRLPDSEDGGSGPEDGEGGAQIYPPSSPPSAVAAPSSGADVEAFDL